jgi:hypothetical protein
MEAVNIKGKDYKLKVTLGFWRMLSFPKSEVNTLYDNAERFNEALRLAIFFGNEELYGWQSLADLEATISQKDIDRIDDTEISNKLSQAMLDSYSKEMREAINKTIDDSKKK